MFVLNPTNTSPAPKLLNMGAFFQRNYPHALYAGYIAAPAGGASYNAANTNITKAIADHTIIETVGSTAINGYFRNLIDAFLNVGNIYTNTDYGTQVEQATGWTGFNFNGLTPGNYTWSSTMRFASSEVLPAGRSVGAEVIFAPAYKTSMTNVQFAGGTTIALTNVKVTAFFKLMRSNGTLVDIGNVVCDNKSINFLNPQNSQAVLMDRVYSAAFTPQTSQAGDRIVIETVFTGNFNIPSNGIGGSGGNTFALALGFGFEGSRRQFSTDYQAARPFCISIT